MKKRTLNLKKFCWKFTAICAVALVTQSCSNDAAETETVSEPIENKVEEPVVAASKPLSKEELMEKGSQVFTQKCVPCHQANGEGIPGAFPPLAKSDYLMADRERSIKQVINGSSGEIVVNGETYNGAMPPQGLNNQEIAAVLTYAMNSWGNTAEAITEEEVAKVSK